MTDKLRLLDLFSGIGGFSLGLERTGGFETVAFCEIEDFPRRVLAKHWPKVPCYEDIRELNAATLRRDGIEVDAICGGFPCQDISTAGKGAGIEGEKSGLWREYARLIGELRPRVVFVENVAALLGRGLDRVLGDLASIGYDAEWHCIQAAHVGAPHLRDRLWITAHPQHTDADSERPHRAQEHINRNSESGNEQECFPRSLGAVLADATSQRQQGQGQPCQRCCQASNGKRQANIAQSIRFDGKWLPEPSVGRVADGVPHRTHRLKALGNAVVPQIPELLGNAYLESINWRDAA